MFNWLFKTNSLSVDRYDLYTKINYLRNAYTYKSYSNKIIHDVGLGILCIHFKSDHGCIYNFNIEYKHLCISNHTISMKVDNSYVGVYDLEYKKKLCASGNWESVMMEELKEFNEIFTSIHDQIEAEERAIKRKQQKEYEMRRQSECNKLNQYYK